MHFLCAAAAGGSFELVRWGTLSVLITAGALRDRLHPHKPATLARFIWFTRGH